MLKSVKYKISEKHTGPSSNNSNVIYDCSSKPKVILMDELDDDPVNNDQEDLDHQVDVQIVDETIRSPANKSIKAGGGPTRSLSDMSSSSSSNGDKNSHELATSSSESGFGTVDDEMVDRSDSNHLNEGM
jgi:hypothetical protein